MVKVFSSLAVMAAPIVGVAPEAERSPYAQILAMATRKHTVPHHKRS